MTSRLLLLLALVPFVLPGCTVRRGGSDDDDDTSDDDDATSDDDDATTDDDDATTDDDDATPPVDDDDFADDDDTPPVDDDDATPFTGWGDWTTLQFNWTMVFTAPDTVNGEFIFVYLDQDPATGQYAVECVQRVEVEGEVAWGFDVGPTNDCTNCTGLIEYDYTSAVDTSNPGINPTDCDSSIFLDENVADYGMGFLTPSGVEPGIIPDGAGDFVNYGDWLTLGVVTSGTHSNLGTDYCLGTPDCTASGLQTSGETDYGPDYVYAAFVAVDGSSGSGTGASLLGLSAVTDPTGNGSDFLYGGTLFRDGLANGYEDPVDLVGSYQGAAGFVLTRQ